jgi:hypothetical protein
MRIAGAHPNQIDLELGKGGEDIEEHLAHGVGRIIHGGVERQLHPPLDQGVGDVAGIGNRTGQSVQFRHDERIANTDGG